MASSSITDDSSIKPNSFSKCFTFYTSYDNFPFKLLRLLRLLVLLDLSLGRNEKMDQFVPPKILRTRYRAAVLAGFCLVVGRDIHWNHWKQSQETIL